MGKLIRNIIMLAFSDLLYLSSNAIYFFKVLRMAKFLPVKTLTSVTAAIRIF